jgi:hypothetical protein
MYCFRLFYPYFRTMNPQLSDSRAQPALVFESDPERLWQTLVISQVAQRGRKFVEADLQNRDVLFATEPCLRSLETFADSLEITISPVDARRPKSSKEPDRQLAKLRQQRDSEKT